MAPGMPAPPARKPPGRASTGGAARPAISFALHIVGGPVVAVLCGFSRTSCHIRSMAASSPRSARPVNAQRLRVGLHGQPGTYRRDGFGSPRPLFESEGEQDVDRESASE